MITINLNLKNEVFSCVGHFKDEWGFKREMDSFKIDYTSGERAYIVPIKNKMGITTIAKKMFFNEGIVSIKLNKQVIEIGTYEIE